MSNVRASLGVGLLLALTLSLLMWVSASPAQAETVADCQARIATLKIQTQQATFFGQNAEKNRAGLFNKLTNASDKLDAGKNQDAIQKLTDFKTTVNSLAGGGKIAPGDAQTLVSGADDAMTCITALQTQTPIAA